MEADNSFEQLLDQCLKGLLSSEERLKFFELLRDNPALEAITQSLLKDVEPAVVEQFLSEKSLVCDTQMLSESDESQIELFLSGLMTSEEEGRFMEVLCTDENLRDNALARAFLFKAIKKVKQKDIDVLQSAKELNASDVVSVIGEIRNEEDDEIIDRYLTDTMSKEEKDAFEVRLSNDERFKERVLAVTMLNKGVIDQQRETELALNDAAKLSKEDILSVIKDEREKKPRVSAIVPWTKFRRVAAVAIIVIIAGGAYDYYNSTMMMNLAGENMEFSMNMYTRGSGTIEEDSVKNELMHLFENIKSRESINETTIERLKEYYNNVNDDVADFEDNYIDEISLALATAYIYTGQRSEAKEVLRNTIASPCVSEEAKEKAENLLSKIKRTIIF